MTVTYRPVTLIGYCYMCHSVHSTDKVERNLEGGQTHCKHCHQKLPEAQRLSHHIVWTCKRTGAELFPEHLFTPPLKTEEPVEDEGKEELLEEAGSTVRVFERKAVVS